MKEGNVVFVKVNTMGKDEIIEVRIMAHKHSVNMSWVEVKDEMTGKEYSVKRSSIYTTREDALKEVF